MIINERHVSGTVLMGAGVPRGAIRGKKRLRHDGLLATGDRPEALWDPPFQPRAAGEGVRLPSVQLTFVS